MNRHANPSSLATVLAAAVLSLAALGTIGAIGACDSTPAGPPAWFAKRQAQVTYWKDIKPLVDASCGGCHSDGGIGPMPLSSYADLKAFLPLVKGEVEDEAMPPWLPNDDGQPLRDVMKLSDADRTMFLKWIDDGAVEGDAAHEGPARPVTQASLSRVDVTLKMPDAYTPTESPDEYRCFVLDWPFATTKYVTGHNVHPGNRSIVHHVIGYLISPENAATVRGFDADDPLPGYRCYGGPTADHADQIPATFLAAWAPGSNGLDRPAGTGLEARPGSLLVLQMHYNISHEPHPAPDLTSIDFSVEDRVDQKAYSIAWFNVSWYFQPNLMDIPAGAESVEHSYEAVPSTAAGVLALSGSETYPNGMMLYSALPHMHTFGQTITIGVKRADGTRETLLTIPKWNFHWQREYVWQTPQAVYPGDELTIDCEWDNSTAAQPMVDGQHEAPRDLGWGEGSADEMCLAMIYVTPR